MNSNTVKKRDLATGKVLGEKESQKKTKGQRARETILVAGEDHFARFGYAGTTLDAVAKQIGISKQSLLHHYASKPKLYSAVIDNIMIPLEAMHKLSEHYVESFSKPLTAQNRADLYRPLEIFIDLITERPTIANLIMFGAVLPENSAVPDEFSKIGARSFTIFEKTFGKIAPNASPEETHHIASTITGSILFYASTLNQMTGKTSKAKRAASKARHKELVLFTAKTLIQEINRAKK
jgi:AcrR family transcriptional regulator